MSDYRDPKTLSYLGEDARQDEKGNIYNKNGYLVQKSQQQLAEEAQAQREYEAYRQNNKRMVDDAIRNAGGIFHMPHINFGLGGILLVGIYALGILYGIALFLESPSGERMFMQIEDFFSGVFFHIGAFLLAWPQTFTEMFDHWFYLPELLIGVFLIYYLLKTADDNGFYREDGFKCFLPYLIIEGIRALFLRDIYFTKLACILRAFGLGIGLCIIVAILKKIFIRY